ncbi:MAG: TetR/AcrR family transcriptional regulator [Deltaproteobacteria bacterium]|nr:TetR/AcrR family transcriptional regulator [Deltaproteobacteria bacterium]
MGIKKESSEVRREQIVNAAIAIIGNEGISSFTTARVAKEVGISEANLYRHFKNKDAIITAVIESVEDTLIWNVEGIREERLPGIEKMERIFKMHLRYIQENNGIPRIVFSSECLFVKGLQKKILSFVNLYMKKLGEVIEEGIKDGSIKDSVNAEAQATILVGMIQFNALRWLLSGFKYSLAEKGEKLWTSYRKNLEVKKKRSLV